MLHTMARFIYKPILDLIAQVSLPAYCPCSHFPPPLCLGLLACPKIALSLEPDLIWDTGIKYLSPPFAVYCKTENV